MTESKAIIIGNVTGPPELKPLGEHQAATNRKALENVARGAKLTLGVALNAEMKSRISLCIA